MDSPRLSMSMDGWALLHKGLQSGGGHYTWIFNQIEKTSMAENHLFPFILKKGSAKRIQTMHFNEKAINKSTRNSNKNMVTKFFQ